MFNLTPVTAQFATKIQQIIDSKTKPLGALGQLETIANRLVTIYSDKAGHLLTNAEIKAPSLIVFAGDHGIAQYGVSIAPSDVTRQVVLNFISGGAAINVFTRLHGWHLDVVDTGIIEPIENDSESQESKVKACRLDAGTKAFHLEAAMSKEQVLAGFEFAKALVQDKHKAGCNLLAFGEMGIGNTSAASAIMAAMLDLPAEATVGKGTGIDDDTLEKKITLIQQALDLHKVTSTQPLEVLAKLGGFEIVQICGAMLAAAELKIPVLVDGFICTAAALVAKQLAPEVMDYLIFAHRSEENAHRAMLAHLNAKPLLDLNLRLGEGTGAALCLPLLQSALVFYNEMASFTQANVDDVVN